MIRADLEGIGREICQSLQREGYTQEVIPNIAVSTNGLNCYDSGQEKAYQALATTFVNEEQEATGDVHVLGATPIDMWILRQIRDCIELLKEAGAKNPIVWGANGGIQEIAGAARFKIKHCGIGFRIKNSKIFEEKIWNTISCWLSTWKSRNRKMERTSASNIDSTSATGMQADKRK